MLKERPIKEPRRWNIFTFSVCIAAFAVVLIPFISNFCEPPLQDCRVCRSEVVKDFKEEPLKFPVKPKYILHIDVNRSDILDAVDRVLHRLGLEKINIIDKGPSEFPQNWNLIWSYKHSEIFRNDIDFTNLKYHQKLNHFPGCAVLVDKSFLSTQNDFDFIPKGFLTSEDVQAHSAQHPQKRYVMKLKGNRGVQLTDPSMMNFSAPKTANDYFAQEFLEDPLLWDGHKFDFSIFVVITSVNPLRLYYYNKNVNLRFCLKPYNTANISDVDSYVIGTHHISGQNFPYVRKHIDAGYTYKDAFEGFMRKIGGNVDEIWMKVENLIRSVVLTKEKYYINRINRLGASKYNFFELYRFDMIFDRNLKLYLIEVNMSPNILAVGDRIHNNFMFENVLYNLFNMVGIGSYFEKEYFGFPNYHVETMAVYHDALTVKPEICLNSPCIEDCSNEICKFCWKCMNKSTKFEMILTFNEQMNRGHYNRLFPVKKEKIMEKLRGSVTEVNLFYVEWFQEMCKKNINFC